MATRNLTRRFLESRNASKANRALNVDATDSSDVHLINLENGDNSSSSSASSGNWTEQAKRSLPPIWVDRIEQIEEDTLKIQSKMKELSTLHSKRLMVDFATDEATQEREIDKTTQAITSIFRHAESLLKQFSKQGDEGRISKQEMTVRNNLTRSTAKKLQGLSLAFRTSQKEYLARMSAQKKGGKATDTNLDFLSNSPSTSSSGADIFSSGQIQELEQTEDLVAERDVEINRVAKSIEELAAIFKELAVLVIDQGTILDRIDYNMEMTVDHTKEGLVQLHKAEEYQKSAFPMRCIIVLVVLIIIMLIVLVVKHQ